MSYYGYPEYVSVAEKQAKADRAIEKLRKKNPDLSPVSTKGSALVTTWWGKSWNRNLESYADYSNRISRGKSYVRHHAVLDLRLSDGKIDALVQGTSKKPYQITVTIDPMTEEQRTKLAALCNNRIDSLEKLLEGKFPKELAEALTTHSCNLFPSPKEIHFTCSCPDYAYMCKHVAAVLYGIGTRLDDDPMLFFYLRGIDCKALVKRSVESRLESMLKNAGRRTERTVEDERVEGLFGV